MPDTAPPRPDAEPQPAPAPRAAEATAPVPDNAGRKPPEEDALFRALVDAGAGAVLAYTADKRIHTMISEAVAPQLQPFLVEMRQRFDAQDRKLDALTDAVAKLTRTVAGHGEKLAEHDRKLDVISARLDGLKAHVQILFGAMALLITVLIAVFGYLFTA